MLTVSYETEGGLFLFDQKEAAEVLQRLEANEANKLMEFLESKPEEVVKMHQEKGSFSYAVLKVLEQGKGSVYCRACGKQYHSWELKCFTIGAGESPFKVNVRWKRSLIKRIFGKPKRLPLFGGKGYKCPEGHRLIFMITWRTQ
jgi:hypothetical protein